MELRTITLVGSTSQSATSWRASQSLYVVADNGRLREQQQLICHLMCHSTSQWDGRQLDYQDTIVQVTGYMLALGFFPRSAATVSALLNWCTFLVAGSPHFVNHFYMKAYAASRWLTPPGFNRSMTFGHWPAAHRMVVTLFAVVPDTTGISVDAALSRLRSYIRGRGTRASPGVREHQTV